eukprot:m.348227 g.348227  ORF g.348227 m.348227 type:complete len:630 (-) comp27934_c4_seq2:2085-3974(-)
MDQSHGRMADSVTLLGDEPPPAPHSESRAAERRHNVAVGAVVLAVLAVVGVIVGTTSHHNPLPLNPGSTGSNVEGRPALAHGDAQDDISISSAGNGMGKGADHFGSHVVGGFRHVDGDSDMEALLETMLKVVNSMAAQWSQLMGSTISQIGAMADRIVATETILSNLTTTCLHCTGAPDRRRSQPARPGSGRASGPGRGSVPGTAGGTDSDPQPQGLVGRPPSGSYTRSSFFLSGAVKRASGNVRHPREDPMAPLIAFMTHMLNQMEQMSGNVTSEMTRVETEIGAMADEIVSTECLIMNMSGQIGTMADRIVHTEEMMSNVSSACCHSGAAAAAAPLQRTAVPVQRVAPSCSAGPNSSASGSNGAQRNGGHGRPRLGPPLSAMHPRLQAAPAAECKPWDVVCIAMKEMTDMAREMDDIMYNLMLHMLNETSAVALEATALTARVIGAEHTIVGLGIDIGKIADGIVDVESKMEHFAQSVCHMPATATGRVGAAAVPPRARRAARGPGPTNADVDGLAAQRRLADDRLHAIALRVDVLLERGARALRDARSPGGVPALMARVMAAMTKMSALMLANMAEMVKGVAQMSDRIVTTVGLIGAMSKQVIAMVGRMETTVALVNHVIADCTPA